MQAHHVTEELRNIALHSPLWPGDTISHATARECVRLGWATMDSDGNYCITEEGKRIAAAAAPRGSA